MGKFLIKSTQNLKSNDTKMELTNINQNFTEIIQPQEQKSAFSPLSPFCYKDQISNKQFSINSSFKIEDILNSNRNSNNENKSNLQFHNNYIDNDFIVTEMEYQLKLHDKGYFLKENFDDLSPKNINNNRKPNEKNASTYFSSSSSSSPSYCSPIQSVYPSYSSHQNPSDIVMPNPLVNTNDFLAKNMAYFNNPFITLTNSQFGSNYQKYIEDNNYDPSMSQMVVQQQLLLKSKEQNKNYLAIEDLIKTTLSSKILVKNYEDTILDNENETKKKIVIIDEIAKKIDAFSESNNNKSQSILFKNNEKDKLKNEKKKAITIKKKEKHKKLSKKRDEDDADEEDEVYKRDDSICNCSDLTCNLSSILPIDNRNLPMCLRGASDEQLHLATLFNTLIHHKKCRRTRTVFSDGQLIGLEKRFENQKYLSTPDRIQLAESLGLSQLQVKTWYQNRRMKWKKKVLKDGSRNAPTKPKGRPKKNSIPSFSEIIKAATEAALNSKSTGSSTESIALNESIYSSSSDESRIGTEISYEDDINDESGTETEDEENNISSMK